jgi:cytoskeletal protein CcmA (bactofilin family)
MPPEENSNFVRQVTVPVTTSPGDPDRVKFNSDTLTGSTPVMALWKEPGAAPNAPPASPNSVPTAASGPRPSAAPLPGYAPAGLNTESARIPKESSDMKESLIAAGLAIEGKIVGNGHVRVAGKFKGDVQVEGNLHIDSGAKVEGQVRALEVIVTGELQGNIESARRVELQQGGVINGDVKAGSLTVAAGSKMRGAVEFGWEEGAVKPASIHADKGLTSVA